MFADMKPGVVNWSGDLLPHPVEKVMSIEDAREFTDGKVVVLTTGTYDLIHAEHFRYLASAAKLGDTLVVALDTDAWASCFKDESRPIIHFQARALALAYLPFVSCIVPNDGDRVSLIKSIRPQFFVMSEATTQLPPEARACEVSAVADVGGVVVAFPIDNRIGITTSKVIQWIRSKA